MRRFIVLSLACAALNPSISAAAVGADAAQKVQAGVGRAFANGQAPAVSGEGPASASPTVIATVAQTAPKSVATFKEATDLVAAKGKSRSFPAAFCSRFEFDCGGQPWPVRYEGLNLEKETKLVSIGKLGAADHVVVFRQDGDKARGELYVSDASGNLLRAYVMVNNGTPSRMTAAQAQAGFTVEKQWWMDWLPANAVSVAENTPAPK